VGCLWAYKGVLIVDKLRSQNKDCEARLTVFQMGDVETLERV
jgi:hypothetical protein